ncbi:hypothetical protein ACFQ7A_04070 [Streptomyces sp. NPDC056528]|uniref:hypothetical protein n=1 Tax=Streptomyces sp. NPDC056528 TaxID=3345854 RepID=UPI00368AE9ED
MAGGLAPSRPLGPGTTHLQGTRIQPKDFTVGPCPCPDPGGPVRPPGSLALVVGAAALASLVRRSKA